MEIEMSFEDIPEDKQESYPCPECQTGKIEEIKVSGGIIVWACDSCDFAMEGKQCGH